MQNFIPEVIVHQKFDQILIDLKIPNPCAYLNSNCFDAVNKTLFQKQKERHNARIRKITISHPFPHSLTYKRSLVSHAALIYLNIKKPQLYLCRISPLTIPLGPCSGRLSSFLVQHTTRQNAQNLTIILLSKKFHSIDN